MNVSVADGEVGLTALDCPVYSNHSHRYIYLVDFWVEGVIQTTLAIPGFLGKVEESWIMIGCRFDGTSVNEDL